MCIQCYRYTAVSVIEMDFDRIDINQCPKGDGNDGPNIFANTSRCKTDTTEVRLLSRRKCLKNFISVLKSVLNKLNEEKIKKKRKVTIFNRFLFCNLV